MNTVTSIQFDFRMENEAFARNLYGRWDSFFANGVERILDEELAQKDREKAGRDIIIKSLELDLGCLSENDFDALFPVRFREKLTEALIQWEVNNEDETALIDEVYTPTGIPSGANSALEEDDSILTVHSLSYHTLCYFLLHGTLPWNATGEHKDIGLLFLTVLQENPHGLKRFLQTYGQYTSLQERLVYQLNDVELEKGVYLITPGSGYFIVSYVKLLMVKYKDCEQPVIRQSSYRHIVWSVVYAYLLTNRSSFFDKKSFIGATVIRLARTYNLSYEQMVSVLTDELRTFAKELSMPPELFQILNELREELSEKQLNASFLHAAAFYKTLYAVWRQDLTHEINNNSREALIQILADPVSGRIFLQGFSEKEIITLIPVVAPQESHFVCEVAHSLEASKDHGALQGKTGGEFRLLKWQIIFPLLLGNKGAGLNRRHFVLSVLNKISAHYNIDTMLLLDYICDDVRLIEKMDAELKKILTGLQQANYRETGCSPIFEKSKQEAIVRILAPQATISAHEQHEIVTTLINPALCHPLLQRLHEKEITAILTVIVPKESGFVCELAHSLDGSKDHGLLQGKGGGEFRLLKWQIIFPLLLRNKGVRLNRKYFVFAVLQKISAHYNLETRALLDYICTDLAVIEKMDSELKKILSHLQQENAPRVASRKKNGNNRSDGIHDILCKQTAITLSEKRKLWTVIDDPVLRKQFITGSNEEQCYALIKLLFPKEEQFIILYAKQLDHLRPYRQTSSRFDNVKWDFLLAFLSGIPRGNLNRTYYVSRVLQSIAAHYNLTYFDLLTFFRPEPFAMSMSMPPVLSVILNELYTEERAHWVDIALKTNNEKSKLMWIRNLLGRHAGFVRAYIVFLQTYLALIQSKSSLSGNPDETIWRSIFMTLFEMQKSPVFDKKQFIARVFNHITARWNLSLTQLLAHLSAHADYQSEPRSKEIRELIDALMNETNGKQSREATLRTVEMMNKDTEPEVEQPVEKDRYIQKENLKQIIMKEQHENLFINNAGIILLSPYLPRLFRILKLTDGEKFKNKESQIKAVYLPQHAAFGRVDFPEHELVLNKLLAGMPLFEAIPSDIALSPDEKHTIDQMLRAVLSEWGKLKDTPIHTLQQAFLQREGKLCRKDDFDELIVVEKSYDLLLDIIPWSFKTTKYSWMEKMIQVKWR